MASEAILMLQRITKDSKTCRLKLAFQSQDRMSIVSFGFHNFSKGQRHVNAYIYVLYCDLNDVQADVSDYVFREASFILKIAQHQS